VATGLLAARDFFCLARNGGAARLPRGTDL